MEHDQAHDHAHEGGAELAVSVLRHRFALVLACAVIAGAGGWYYGAAQPASYTSSASVLINPVADNPYAPASRQDDLVSLETEAQVVSSDAVLQLVSERAPGSPPPAQLESNVHVVVPPNTSILDISYDATDPGAATAVAQAFATSYLEHRQERAEVVVTNQLADLDAQIEKVLLDLRTATEGSREGPTADRVFQSELAAILNGELINLRAQRIALENDSPEPGRIISPATVPVEGSPIMQQIFPVGGALAGLLLGASLAAVLERKRGLVRSPLTVRAAGLPVLATVSRTSWRRRARLNAGPDFDEAIRRVRTTILDTGHRNATVTVACSSQGAVEPGVARALAESLVRAGNEVILIDADAQPGQRGSATEESVGLTDVLSGRRSDVSALLRSSGVSARLRLLARGRAAPEFSDYVAQGQVKACLDLLTKDCDFLVVRAPTLQSTNGEALARAADFTLVVVTAGRDRRQGIVTVVERARESRTTLLGSVLVPSGATVTSSKRDRREKPTEGSPQPRAQAPSAPTSPRSSNGEVLHPVPGSPGETNVRS